MTRKTLLIILTIGLIVSLSGLAASSVLADNNNPVIQRLAEAFGVEEDEVEAVFDAVREEHRGQMREKHQERLAQAVEDGVITEEQAQTLQDKHQQIWGERNQERREHYEEMEAWFEQEGIDHEALMQYSGGPGPKGEFGMKGHTMRYSK